MRARITLLLGSLLCLLCVLAWAGVGHAFPYHWLYHTPASGDAASNRAGAEGIYGTGSKTEFGIKCSHCHIDSAGMIDSEVLWRAAGTTDPFVKISADDSYTPGQAYDVRVRLLGEHLMAFNPMNAAERTDSNGFSLAIENASGNPVGVLEDDWGNSASSCPASDPAPGADLKAAPWNTRTTVVYGDCHAMLFLGRHALTEWSFKWTAPAAGQGELSIYVAVVDGDTGGDNSQDDDVHERVIPIREGS